MARDSKQLTESVSRRKFLVASGAAGLAGLAGCSGSTGSETDAATDAPETEAETDAPETEEETAKPEDNEPEMLTAEGSSTVYPIANKGSSYWNSNAPPSDGEYWGSSSEGTVPGWSELGEPDMRLADYFASLYGFEPTETQANPPFATSIGLSHSGTGCKSVRDGLVDIGNSSGPITAELGISEAERDEKYVDHVVGRDGQPVVVSKDIFDAGVTELTGEEVKKIYQDEITNWKDVGGPDKEIYVVGRAEGSGTDTSFRLNMLGDAEASMEGVDTRKGQNQQVKTVVQQNEGAIAYMALAFTGPEVKPVGIEFEGTLFEPDKDAENTIFDSAYPLNRDLHQYTTITEGTPNGTDKREAAFINMFLTTFGQELFVEANNYIPLPTKDLEAEKAKLPDQA
ncbi:substrate-binding domain-containing protein [Haloferax larsenii]|uniref:Substrate-binding domain-containing protein n=1 Tax=Haloferax larsenii TaxID=302484 RepID=A0ABY5RGP6_HALLR|nr:substrate-binding domain-containing protein [Haloferax larsenii]ELZ80855.1 phosphate ABC transporter substrate-binding protein [Haloferax larsenii JCM 13917]UVE51073.1 substrate-binding domain-containing protein [Haloferax larsenii]